MMKSKKLIAILTVVALLASLAATALADDKIYTSPTFKIPKDRIVISETITPEIIDETAGDDAGLTEDGEPLDGPVDETGELPEGGEALDGPVDETGELPEGGEAPDGPADETGELPEGGEAPDGPADETGELPEGGEALDGPADETGELPEDGEPADGTEDAAGEEVRVERQVKIYSTRKAKVYETEIIEMTSELIGFGDEEVTYQWQVDRGDGLGWVDVENATRWKYTFIVDRETALYNWRLIVTVVE